MSAGQVFEIELPMQRQPDDASCGPTALQAVYRFHGDPVDLSGLIDDVHSLPEGGTLAVHLANHALTLGYRAHILTFNLTIFDPTWFGGMTVDLAAKLREQAEQKSDTKLRNATEAYLKFLRLGGTISMEDLTASLIRRWIARDVPILTGLSATFLYRCSREVGETELHDDDVRGDPTGHFVVLCGYDEDERLVRVADPWEGDPPVGGPTWIPVARLINGILLGVLTYDANLLILEK